MKIAVLSGKGGTGKTTVSTNLVNVFKNMTLIDCDVEEPNAHLFFSLNLNKEESVYSKFPQVDETKCSLCGKCKEFCNFNAILPAKKKVLVFAESCHYCGGCSIVCPNGAISYTNREIGKTLFNTSSTNIKVNYGKLNIGELSAVKVIENCLKSVSKDEDIIIDCPPGTSCATVSAVSEADYAIIVSEPTPFGVSDMKMVVEMLENLGINFGLIVNKAGLGNQEIYEYAHQKGIEILGEIPFSQEVAHYYSNGYLITEKLGSVKEIFCLIAQKVSQKVKSFNSDC